MKKYKKERDQGEGLVTIQRWVIDLLAVSVVYKGLPNLYNY